jgi:hypothetical protein
MLIPWFVLTIVILDMVKAPQDARLLEPSLGSNQRKRFSWVIGELALADDVSQVDNGMTGVNKLPNQPIECQNGNDGLSDGV